MKDLVEALTILLRYGNPRNPTHCEHDVLTICGIDPKIVSDQDKARLNKLGFFVHSSSDEDECFQSFRFGSA